jgi:hypothetical protein
MAIEAESVLQLSSTTRKELILDACAKPRHPDTVSMTIIEVVLRQLMVE